MLVRQECGEGSAGGQVAEPIVLIFSRMMQEHDHHTRWLRDQGLTVRLANERGGRGEEDLLRLLPGVAATIASTEPYTRRVLARADALRIIARTGVGFDAIDVAAATEHEVAVTTTPGTNERAVADYTMGLLLALARQIPANVANVRAGTWQTEIGPDVGGATLGIVGLGLIGRAVARRARGFDMRVLAFDVQPDANFAAANGIEVAPLEAVLAEADFVTLHVPLMAATRHLLNADRLALMKPGAYLVNTSRGGVVDEAALAAALATGRLAGAALDVFEREPPWGSPLLTAPNLLASPHVAGISHGSREAMVRMACRSVVQRLRGEAPMGLVNPAVMAPRPT
jgi:phosphoglycerate dehydrogenase-like enzyme